jgi:AcrR family transcriptional regulator
MIDRNPVRQELVATLPHSSRGRERLARILDAATDLFLRTGYADTSIDAILERSGGSKATLYAYFPTKEDLFRAVIDTVVSNRKWPELDVSADLRSVLHAYAVQRMTIVFSERHRALLRLIIAEGQRFPDIARMYYELGPQRGRGNLADHLRELGEREGLVIENPQEAAEFFIGMLFHHWYTVLLYLNAPLPTGEAIEERARRAVERFIKAFHPATR